MMSKIYDKYRFLIARRVSQVLILALYIAANAYGIKILEGNLSSSLFLSTIPLSDPFALLQILATGAIVSIDVIIGAVLIALFYGGLVGRAFCSWVCPINIVTDLANWLRRKLALDKTERKVWLSRNVRFWVMGLTLVVSAIAGIAAFEVVSPIGILQRGIVFGMGMGGAAVLAIFLFDLFAVKNGWCGHVCPLGGFYSTISKWSLIRVHHDQPSCTLCMRCKDICPEKHVLEIIGKRSGDIIMGECINCGRCIEVCEDNALSFGVRSYINQHG
ncbi:MAG: quinol dehydrogenase ferredoxin subunit NapH [Tenuifilaceae bacterium]|jgi:ferredoxin-type protein NapH|nr:quinol dehydrogenase ferredoxin subunit NapH [Tenuifilaceae bacterium]